MVDETNDDMTSIKPTNISPNGVETATVYAPLPTNLADPLKAGERLISPKKDNDIKQEPLGELTGINITIQKNKEGVTEIVEKRTYVSFFEGLDEKFLPFNVKDRGRLIAIDISTDSEGKKIEKRKYVNSSGVESVVPTTLEGPKSAKERRDMFFKELSVHSAKLKEDLRKGIL